MGLPVWVEVSVLVGVGWVVLVSAVGGLFGWGALARQYRATAPFTGRLRRFQSAKIGLANYGGILTVGTDPAGLYLAVFPLFRPGHPPVFAPWGDVTATPGRGWLGPYLDLRFAAAPRVAVRVSQSLGRRIAADANRAWADLSD